MMNRGKYTPVAGIGSSAVTIKQAPPTEGRCRARLNEWTHPGALMQQSIFHTLFLSLQEK